jgi:hypothetical protein
MDIQGGKKNKVRIDTIRPKGDQSPHPIARTSIASGGKEVKCIQNSINPYLPP